MIALTLSSLVGITTSVDAAQSSSREEAPGVRGTASGEGGKDVVVTGKRDKPAHGKTIITGSGRTQGLDNDTSPIELQYRYAYAEDVARCALNDGARRLSDVVDGPPNYSTQIYAQDWILRNNITCSVGANLLTLDPPKLGYSIYQRGALMAHVIKTYAPGLKLTRAETLDPVVIARFEAREGPRNRYRLPVDQRYFRAVVCMVQLSPEKAVRIVIDDLTRKQRAELQSAFIDEGRACLGNPHRVYVESTQFRVYVTDALYRWAVAARGTSSLLPIDR